MYVNMQTHAHKMSIIYIYIYKYHMYIQKYGHKKNSTQTNIVMPSGSI